MKRDKQHIENELQIIKVPWTLERIAGTILPLLGVFLILVIILPGWLNNKTSHWESRAKANLRAFGETQMAYQQVNLEGYYGSWEALSRTGYVPEGYTMDNAIENYLLHINIYKPTEPNASPAPTFTAIAFPLVTSPPGYLATFAIHEDQVLRAYRPQDFSVKVRREGGDINTRIWTPIR